MQSSAPLVTGSSDGIGLETARQLARHGAAVIVHGRRPDRVSAARQSVESFCGRAMPEPIVADLSSLAGAAGLAVDLARRGQFPDVLVNNAGVFIKQIELSADTRFPRLASRRPTRSKSPATPSLKQDEPEMVLSDLVG